MLEEDLQQFAQEQGFKISFFQSNVEGEIINCLQTCHHQHIDGIVINPAAFTHYSYAIADALKSISVNVVEVHISNIYKREEFRQHSVTAGSCVGVISGLGMDGYKLALLHLLKSVEKS